MTSIARRLLLLSASVAAGVSWVMVTVFALMDGYVEDPGQAPTDFGAEIVTFCVTGAVTSAFVIALALRGSPRSRPLGSEEKARDAGASPGSERK